MDHEAVTAKVTDWVEGRLDPVLAVAVEAHVRDCAECRGAAEIARGVQAEVAAHGEHLFSPHPAPEKLARFALDPDSLPLHELSGCRGHVAACPMCAHELAMLRAANAPSPLREVLAWLHTRPVPSVRFQWAFAVLAAVLVLPAYLGLVELPRERERARLSTGAAPSTAATEPRPAPSATPWSGGGADVIVLTGPTRGVRQRLPVLRLRPGQPVQPILVDAAIPTTDSLAFRLLESSGRVAWSITLPRAAVWDVGHTMMSLLVPAAVLAPGYYRLEVAAPPGAAPSLSAPFRVEPTP